MSKMYEIFSMLRKIVCAAVFGGLMGMPVAQTSTAGALSFLFMVYTTFCNPYGLAYKIFDVVSELANLTIAGTATWLAMDPTNIKAG